MRYCYRVRLAGKVALVTGGGSGIGAASARLFAREGAKVVVTGRRPDPLRDVAAETDGVAVPGDAADPDDVRRAVRACRERFGGLDVLLANAGGEGGGPVAETSDEVWAASLRSNLTTAFVCAREALPAMLERGTGSIVVVSSEAALAPAPGIAGYNTSKTALLGLVRSLAVDYGPHGIRANALCPGWVQTPMADQEMDRLGAARGLSRDEAYALAGRPIPLRRAASPGEIASVCLFLASDESSFLTGAVIPADGGASAVDAGTLPFLRGYLD